MPRQGLNRRKVLEAALRVVDEEGLEELTMRRLAQILGVEAPSLYKHVDTKDDILSGIAELVYEEIELDQSEGTLRDRAQSYAASCRRALLRHPNAVPLMATRPVTGAATVALAESALRQLRHFGFDPEEGRRFLNVAFSFIVGHALAEVGAARTTRAQLRATRRDDNGAELRSMARSLGFAPVDRDAEFELGIDLLVAGLKQRTGLETAT